jgi:hypothetical protein
MDGKVLQSSLLGLPLSVARAVMDPPHGLLLAVPQGLFGGRVRIGVLRQPLGLVGLRHPVHRDLVLSARVGLEHQPERIAAVNKSMFVGHWDCQEVGTFRIEHHGAHQVRAIANGSCATALAT